MKANLHGAVVASEPYGIDTAVSPWRPIHYLGSKLRALTSIEDALSSVTSVGSTVYDIFSGSGTVSSFLAQSRPVVSVDIQEYSRVLNSSLLSPVAVSFDEVGQLLSTRIDESLKSGVISAVMPLIEVEQEAIKLASQGKTELLADLLEAGSLQISVTKSANAIVDKAHRAAERRISSLSDAGKYSAMMLRHFGGLYFSFRQAAELDVILSLSHSYRQDTKDTLIAAALTCASDLVNTVGKQFAQPIRPRNKEGLVKGNLYGLVARDRMRVASTSFLSAISKYSNLRRPPFDCRAVRSDYLDFISETNLKGGVVYADPPYTRDHYSRFYHVLETMALRDDPRISTNKVNGQVLPSRGAYREERHQSPFCIRSQAPLAFDQMFEGVAVQGVPIVVSYSPYAADKDAHPRVMTIDAILEISRNYYAEVDVVSVGSFVHSKLNRTDLNKEGAAEAEFLIICKGAR
jgi:adenine-specific DNA methylase